ncbi:MAG: 3'-5' exonuclease [Arenicellales bacterium]|jgi:predicted PolB exonuclease-like 3'-5' exonuclease|nr:3'-5' exonuclease [Arenicellales bacterium]
MLPQRVLVFDIETIPDVAAGRRLLGLEGLSDQEVVRAMRTRRLQKTGASDFLAHPYHQIIAISVALRADDSLSIWSLGETNSDESELLERFFDGIERFTPILVSWNGSGFDLPVIHYRSLLHGVAGNRYWDIGESDRDFKWNNYLNRYHARHLDLMDVLSGYQPRATAPLQEIALLLGFPGKMGMSGAVVWDKYQAGALDEIRHYCETDVLNTFLVYLQFEKARGNLSPAVLDKEHELLADTLQQSAQSHLLEFLRAWKSLGRPEAVIATD